MAGPGTREITRKPAKNYTDGASLVRQGYLLVTVSVLILLFGIYALILGPAFAYFGVRPLEMHRTIAADTHYKYFPFLMVPAGLLFVIANWVGWQYYQNS
ncbi:hypothetical protein FS749_005162 [Ceratobasidium sp. UAMH 11750]|nr:hypothetical protein FS749_005162 [Ceratobasidium sp. UAMH 11750]